MVANIGLALGSMKMYTMAVDYWGLGCVAYELETCSAAGSMVSAGEYRLTHIALILLWLAFVLVAGRHEGVCAIPAAS